MYKKIFSLTLFIVAFSTFAFAQTKFTPQDTEFYEPKLRTVEFAISGVPTDAIVLFDGRDLSQWHAKRDSTQPALWTVEDGILQVKPSSGDIQTKAKFEDFQLHIEWKSPKIIKGEGQGRGNSGIFLQGFYEVQVLDNHNNSTYVNGQAASLYKQHPPLVTVIPPAEQWHIYDIVYTAPRFNKDGIRIRKGHVTVLHNGVVVQYNTAIEGTTEYIGMPQNTPHAAGPIVLQDHGDLVQFRNIWIRKL